MKIFFLLLVLYTILFAEQLSPEQLQIREMIQEIKEASPEERFAKMNAFKKHLRAMNQQSRKEAIQSLQNSMNHQGASNLNHKQMQQTQLQEAQKQLQMQQQIQNQQQIKQMAPLGSDNKKF